MPDGPRGSRDRTSPSTTGSTARGSRAVPGLRAAAVGRPGADPDDAGDRRARTTSGDGPGGPRRTSTDHRGPAAAPRRVAGDRAEAVAVADRADRAAGLAGLPDRRAGVGVDQDRQGRRVPERRPAGRAARHDVPARRLRQPRGPHQGAAQAARHGRRARASAPTRSCCCTPAAGPTCCCRSPATRWCRSRATAPPRSTPRSRSAARSCWCKTIEQNTGVRIDHYVEIGFGGFVNSVDAVGGITICPKRTA